MSAKRCALTVALTAEDELSRDTYLRTVSNGDLTEGVYRLLVRTARHVHAALSQEPFALDDLATTLRALLGSSRGNNALVELAARLKVDEPTFAISEEATEGKEVEFSFGAMPTERDIAFRTVGLSELRRSRVLVVKHGTTAQSITWQRLIDDYGNTWGAHLSTSVPLYLDRVQIAASQIGSLGPHLLIAVAIEILNAASAAFSGVRDDFAPLGTIHRIEHYVRGGTVLRSDEQTVSVVVGMTNIEPTDRTLLLGVTLEDGLVVGATYKAPDKLLIQYGGFTIEGFIPDGLRPWTKTATPKLI